MSRSPRQDYLVISVFTICLPGAFDVASHNPCSSASKLAGDIDYEGTITLDLGQNQVSFDGKIDSFPAFEMHVMNGAYDTTQVFVAEPEEGQTVMSLPGDASVRVREKANFTPIENRK